MRVEIFKTNIVQPNQADHLIGKLQQHFPEAKINFDLEDCDKILRIENHRIPVKTIIGLLREDGFQSEVLL